MLGTPLQKPPPPLQKDSGESRTPLQECEHKCKCRPQQAPQRLSPLQEALNEGTHKH